MATATEISTRALRRIGVVDAESSPSASSVAAAIEALEAMINAWETEGLSGDILPLDARFEQGVVAMLAVRLCEEYGKTPGPVLVSDASRGWSQIAAAFTAVPNSTFETALICTGSGVDLLPCSDSETAWLASTDYALRQYVINNANLYECVTAGTSAASGGPEGTDAEITDGTVVWCWRRVTA